MITYYDILGVPPAAKAGEVKAAYRQLAMQFHPDRTPGANKAVQRLIEDKFKEVLEAYDTLKDEIKRAEYDNMLAMLYSQEYYQPPPPPPPPAPPPSQEGTCCPKCRKPLPASATPADRFCGFCGASLQSSPSRPEQRQQPPQPQPAKLFKVGQFFGRTLKVIDKAALQNDTAKTCLVIAGTGAGILVWLGCFSAIEAVFPHVTDGAALASAFLLLASPFVLWTCVTKAKIKWPMPALLPFFVCLCFAATITGVGQRPVPRRPPIFARAAQTVQIPQGAQIGDDQGTVPIPAGAEVDPGGAGLTQVQREAIKEFRQGAKAPTAKAAPRTGAGEAAASAKSGQASGRRWQEKNGKYRYSDDGGKMWRNYNRYTATGPHNQHIGSNDGKTWYDLSTGKEYIEKGAAAARMAIQPNATTAGGGATQGAGAAAGGASGKGAKLTPAQEAAKKKYGYLGISF